MSFKFNFKRIISSGNFIPEIDGLRFIAIFSVLLYHVHGFLSEKDHKIYQSDIDVSFITRLIKNGDFGVPLFFVISGFILAKPFAESIVFRKPKIDLKKYFLRRVTRLEPPYFISMIVLFFISAFILKKYELSVMIESLLASLTYTHNFFYGRDTLPLINAVAWSLEIEIQFYLLAPILTLVFYIKNAKFRRTLLILSIISFIILKNSIQPPFRSLYDYLHYFLVGFLLVDFYINKERLFKKNLVLVIFFFTGLYTIWLFDVKNIVDTSMRIFWDIIQITIVFYLYHFILQNKINSFFSNKFITSIGGMCYTIYLIHYPIISFFGNPLVNNIYFSDNLFVNRFLYGTILIFLVLFFSSIFFLLVERPCMDKYWPQKLKLYIKNKL